MSNVAQPAPPTDEEIFQAIAACLQFADSGMVAEFEDLYGQLEQCASDWEEMLLLRAIKKRLDGKNEEAITLLKTLIEKQPEFTIAHFHLGEAYKQAGELGLATACYTQCTELDPTFVDAFYALAALCFQQHQFESAFTFAIGCTHIAPDHYAAWHLIPRISGTCQPDHGQ